MSKEEFKKEVLRLLCTPEYSNGHPRSYLEKAVEEYEDLIDSGYEDATEGEKYGFEWHADNTALNISMCI